jgi:predicted DNA-binding WGR domain protein
LGWGSTHDSAAAPPNVRREAGVAQVAADKKNKRRFRLISCLPLTETGPRFPGPSAPCRGRPRRPSPPATAPPKKKPASPAASPAAGGKPRHCEFVGGNSSKFWEVSQSGNTMTTRWGRIGATGQWKTKTFADDKAARNAMAALIEEKTDEGYVERA